MLVCNVCKKETNKYANGKKCRECYNAYMNIYMARRYASRRQRAIKILGGHCVQCGSTKDLEFDHIDRLRKQANIGDLLTYSESKFLKELEKCQLLCVDCHKEKTREEQSVPHGGGISGKKNCYCDLCKPLKREYNRNWKKNHPGYRHKQGSLVKLISL